MSQNSHRSDHYGLEQGPCRDNLGQVRGWPIGGLAGIQIPQIHQDGETKDETAVLDMKDLSKFTWPETCASTEPRNLSMWRDGLELVQGIRTEDGTETDEA